MLMTPLPISNSWKIRNSKEWNFEVVYENAMKANPNKFHPLLTTKEDNCVTIAGGKAKNS